MPVDTFSILVSAEEAKTLNSLLAKGMIRDAAGFRIKIDSLIAADAEKNHRMIGVASRKQTTGNPVDYVSATDAIDLAISSFTFQPVYYGGDGNEIVSTYILTTVPFPIRGNQMTVKIPFLYDWSVNAVTGTNQISYIRQATTPPNPIQLFPTGGSITMDSYQTIYSTYDPDPVWHQSYTINALASAKETRTEIWSTSGEVEVSDDANTASFPIGTQLHPGFIIQSASNIYNQYLMTLDGIVHIDASGIWGTRTVPHTSVTGTMHCQDYGILQNN